MRSPSTVLLLLVTLACIAGCGESETPPTCTPDRTAFDTEIRPRLERYCGSCHGERPDFGAPTSLLDVEELLAVGMSGERLVDHVARRLAEGSMPPVGMPRIPEADADVLAGWASCGTVDVPPRAGLVSSAPPFLAPAEAPRDTVPLDLLADEHAVGEDVRDEYACFVVDLDLPSDRFVRRFEMVLDETRVLHHVILSRDTERRTSPGFFVCDGGGGIPFGSEYLFTWAPGGSALELPGGGLRVRPGERFILQVHYNNGAGLAGVRDSSGVRLFLGPPEGLEYGMIGLGPASFELPARARTTVSGRCRVETPMTLLAGMPHMHQHGTSFSHTLERDGTERDLVTLTGWDFGTQLFYAFPTELVPGDVVHTECTFTNATDDVVRFGENTEDEMCNGFVYVTPPPAELSCDEGDPSRPTDVDYVPGACAMDGGATPALVRGEWLVLAEPEALTTGVVPQGTWDLVSVSVPTPGGETPIGPLVPEESYALARGRIVVGAGTLSFDVDSTFAIRAGTRNVATPSSESFTIPFDEAQPSALEAVESCPSGGASRALEWGIEGDELIVRFTRTTGLTLWPTYRFRRSG